MPISSVKRTTDTTGDDIKTITDAQGRHIQIAALADANGDQTGITGNPLKTDGSAATQPVSAASLPLPSGAATESTLAAIQLAARFQGIFPNHVDAPDSTTTYVGKEDKDGAWLVQKISVSGTVTTLTYATVTNNGAVLTYSAAWAARATTLTYGTFAQAF